jgi:hypothetical protein
MPPTHENPTTSASAVPLNATHLNATHTLVGESGGLSSVYDAHPSSALAGLLRVETEHGPLYLDPDTDVDVLTPFDHDATPDDLPEPGERCKECAAAITWLGPAPASDWLHVEDPRNTRP